VWRPYNPGTLPKDWYILASKTNIVTIEFVDEYVPTGEETNTWPADSEGKINCYVVGTKLIISGNGSGEILASVDQSGLFSGFTKLTSVKGLELLNTENTTNLSNMFYNCSSLYSIDISVLDTSKVTNMSNMFYECSALRQVSITNTSAVTNMTNMFYNCTALTTLDLDTFDTRNVLINNNIFYGCRKLKQVTIGENCNLGPLLPTPSDSYITGADGRWYPSTGGLGVTKISAAGTYYAVPSEVGNVHKLQYAGNNPDTWYLISNLPTWQGYAGSATSYTFTISSLTPTHSTTTYHDLGFHYTFQGWSTSSSATSASYRPGETIEVTGTTTLYAVWKWECKCCTAAIPEGTYTCSTCGSNNRCYTCGKCTKHYTVSYCDYCCSEWFCDAHNIRAHCSSCDHEHHILDYDNCYCSSCENFGCSCDDCCTSWCETCEMWYCSDHPCNCE